MCRLFAMTAGPQRTRATFWLLEAPDSLAEQSRREPDGTGLGTFDERDRPVVEKQPIAAYADRTFAAEARERCSRTFLAHVRFASTGDLSTRNTHPFEQDGRLLAHNGVIEDLPALDAHLGADRALARGETDSERFFALVTRETRRAGGDVGAGLAAAARWTARHLPVYALNVLLTTPTDVWALRYPETHDLLMLERASSAGTAAGRALDQGSGSRGVRVRSEPLTDRAAVIFATEAMDDDAGWTDLEPGVLVHVDGALRVTRRAILDGPPRHPLTLGDLGERAARSQAAAHAEGRRA